jgi:hypothetical protein
MDIEINIAQLVGMLLIVIGLILNTLIFVFSYYKIVSHLKQLNEEKEAKKKKSFPIIRFIFRFRKVLKEITDGDKKENYELVIAFLKWTLLLGTIMILGGLLLFLIGFFF